MSEETKKGALSPEQMSEFLDRPLLARIATANARTLHPHVVPVWYLWDGESIWISSFCSTRKIKDLKGNPSCSIVIDAEQSVLFEGKAELVTEPRPMVEEITTRIYTRYLGPEGVLAPEPQSWIHDDENLLIKLTPTFRRAW